MQVIRRPRSLTNMGLRPSIPTLSYALLALTFTLTAPFQTEAREFFVDQNHPSANDQNPGTSTQPWETITKANQTLAAGDIVYIKEGTYTSYISPINSGTSANPITYRNYAQDVITVTNTSYGVLLNGRDYIVVQGINFSNLDHMLYLNAANHNTIAYCKFDQMRSNSAWEGSRIYNNSQHNWIHHNQFSKWGYFTNQDNNVVFELGNEYSSTDLTYYNLIENNTMFHGGHHVMGAHGRYNVIRNNYFHNEAWYTYNSVKYGNRVVYSHGYPANTGWNLFEGNRIAYSAIPSDDCGASGMSLATRNNIVRFNSFYHNNLSGLAMGVTSSYFTSPSYNKVYNNTFLHNGSNTGCGSETRSAIALLRYSGTAQSHPIEGNMIKNNIMRYNPTSYTFYPSSLVNDQTFAGNYQEAGDPLFVDASATMGDPLDATLPDLHLRANSPAVDKGVYLTTVISPSGSGTSFSVENAGYFMDGWGIIQGDNIQLQGSSQRAQITNVDYTQNTITVDRSIIWTQSQGISLAYEGAAPDVGAYELLQSQAPSAPRNLRVLP